MSLQHRKILVTGASRGIGKALALGFAREGVSLALHCHHYDQEAEAVLKEVRSLGSEAHLFQADFADVSQVIQLGEKVWEQMHGIDVLINNVGVSYKQHFFDATAADIDHFTTINFKSTILLTQSIARNMAKAEIAGSVYTITSINAIQPGVGLSIYGASKAALETAMKGIALELAPHQINVNTIAAGAIDTDMNQAILNDPARKKTVEASIPLGRMGKAEEVAHAIIQLINTGSYITGATIKIDGGWLLKHGFVNPEKYSFGIDKPNKSAQ